MDMKFNIMFFAGLVAFATTMTVLAITFVVLGNMGGYGIGLFAISNWILVKEGFDELMHEIEFEKWMESLER